MRRWRAIGGPRAGGRSVATPQEWAIIRTAVILRARSRCQVCGARRPLDVHHIVKRSQGGSDFDLDRLVALCRCCHAWTDAPYQRGRLVITPRGDGTWGFERVWRPSKWAAVGEVRTPWPRGAQEGRTSPDNRDPRANRRRCHLHHGGEEVVIHYPGTLDADTARRVVAGVLDTGRVPPSAPRETPGTKSRIIRILRRLWIGEYADEDHAYVIVFIDDTCVVRPPTTRPSDAAEAASS